MKRNNWIARLLVVVMSFSVLAPGITLSGQEQTLAISTEKELVAFSKKCKRDSWSKGKHVVLKADLDLSEIDFSPIPIFAGTFDGGGHTISGLKVKAKGSAQGLFRYIEEGAVVKNLKVEGVLVPGGEQKYIGGIAGSNKGTLQQCEFTGTVEGDRTVGGLVGINEATGKLIECHVSGTLQGKQAIGGIAGENKGTIVACTSSAQVNTKMVDTKALDVSNLMARDLEETDVETLEQKADASDIQDIGGIVGVNTGIVQDCTNSGRIGYKHVGYNVGGIAGRQSGYITGCTNTGVVSGRKEVGGIVGQMEPYVVLKFSQSKLHQLSQELDTLQSLIQQATQSGDAGSDAISDQLSTVQDHVTSAREETSALLGQTQDLVNQNIDKVNDISLTIGEVLDRLVPISDHLVEMAAGMEAMADPIQEALSYLEKASDHMADGMGELEDVTRELTRALEDVEQGMTLFRNGLSAIDMGVSQITSGDFRGGIASIKRAFGDLEQSSQYLQWSLTSLREANRQIGQALSVGGQMQADLSQSVGALEESMQQMEEVLGSLRKAFEDLRALSDFIAQKPEVQFVTTDETYEAHKQSLSETLGAMSEDVSKLGQVMNQESHTFFEHTRKISDQMFVILDLLVDMTGEVLYEGTDKSGHQEDISQTDTEDQTEGKVASCINKGDITGDINVGGIAGAMAVERSFDPEDDIAVKGEKSLNFMFQSRAVIRGCQSEGQIKAKKDGVGGIVGSMKQGYIVDSQAEGKIISSDGNYVGGIAGTSQALIRSSYAKCTLEGGNYIGGIAGEGKEIIQCGSSVQITRGAEYIGAIAGALQEEAKAKGNYFVEGDWEGIDDISYEGQADPLSYQDFVQREGVPSLFERVNLRFWVADDLVTTIPLQYGEQLEDAQVPVVPPREGYYGVWGNLERTPITFDQDIEADYKAFVTTLASKQMRGDVLPLVLIEGQFRESDQLILEDLEGSAMTLSEEQTLLEQWQVQLPEDGVAAHTLRYLMPETSDRLSIYMKKNNTWEAVKSKRDGKYMVFEVSGDQVQWCVVAEPKAVPVAPIAIGTFILLVIGFGIFGARRYKKNQSQEEILV